MPAAASAWTSAASGSARRRTGSYALAREFGAETFPTYAGGENALELKGRDLVRYTGTIPKLGPHVLADIGQAMFKLDRMAKQVPRDAPWNARKAERWDSGDGLVVDAAQHAHRATAARCSRSG